MMPTLCMAAGPADFTSCLVSSCLVSCSLLMPPSKHQPGGSRVSQVLMGATYNLLTPRTCLVLYPQELRDLLQG